MTSAMRVADDSSATAEVAALVLTAAMADTQWPAADLGGALERMSRTVNAWRNRPLHLDSTAEADQCCEAVANELAICVQSLQYHDRLMQQLSAIRELLATLAAAKTESCVAARSDREWQETVEQLRGRMTAGSQNQILKLLMRNSGVSGEAIGGGHAAQGSVELF